MFHPTPPIDTKSRPQTMTAHANTGGAMFDPTRMHRYVLWRWVDEPTTDPLPLFICYNPSTATAEYDDHTTRRLIGQTRKWGYPGFMLTNLYSFRATKPADLPDHHSDRTTRHTDAWIDTCVKQAAIVVAAWGTLAKHEPHRVLEVCRILDQHPDPIHCIYHTRNEHPIHPLTAGYMSEPTPWRPHQEIDL